jgi:hypothetical protein
MDEIEVTQKLQESEIEDISNYLETTISEALGAESEYGDKFNAIITKHAKLVAKLDDLEKGAVLQKQKGQMGNQEKEGISSLPGSRGSSPAAHYRHGVYVHVGDAQRPNELTKSSRYEEVTKFIRRFQKWMNTSYPSGYDVGHVVTQLQSFLDEEWELAMGDLDLYDNEEEIFQALREQGERLDPQQNRRVRFIELSPHNKEKFSAYWRRLTDMADQAALHKMTVVQWVCHIFLRNVKEYDVSSKFRQEIIQLMENKNLSYTDIMVKLQNLEARLTAQGKTCEYTDSSGTSKSKARQSRPEKKKWCDNCYVQTHTTSECGSPCWNCGEKGHPRKSCTKPKKEILRDRTPSRKRDKSKDKSSKKSKSKQKKSKKKVRRTSSDSEAATTDSSGGSESETEEASSSSEEKEQKKKKNKKKAHRVTSFRVEGETHPDTPPLLARLSPSSSKRRASERVSPLIPDTGATICSMGRSTLKYHGLKMLPTEGNEPDLVSYSGDTMTPIGRCQFWAHIQGFNSPRRVMALVLDDSKQQVDTLISWGVLKDWGVIPPCFPLPPNKGKQRELKQKSGRVDEKRGSERSSIDLTTKQDDTFLSQKKVDDRFNIMKNRLLKQYSDIFKEDLEKSDIVDCPKVELEIDESCEKPRNNLTAAEIPIHLRAAADKELKRALRAGWLEPCNHPTEWCSRGLFIQKSTNPGEEIKVRIVADFRSVNRILKRPGYPLEGSQHLLKRLNPKHKFFAAVDLSSGYNQIYLPKKYRDYFTVVLPQGKFRFTRVPQGSSPASDLFNIATDVDIRTSHNSSRTWMIS